MNTVVAQIERRPNTWNSRKFPALRAGIVAYSGMAYDSTNHKLLVFGGGHWDHSGILMIQSLFSG